MIYTASVKGFPTGLTPEIKIYDITTLTLIQDWTNSGVFEIPSAMSLSDYFYSVDLTEGHAFQIVWRDTAVATRVGGLILPETWAGRSAVLTNDDINNIVNSVVSGINTGLGSGDNSVQITVCEHGTTTPLIGYHVDFYNEDESRYLGTLQTDTMGKIITTVVSGTYKLRGRLLGAVPDNAVETMVVAGAVSMNLYATPVPYAAAQPGEQLLTGTLVDEDGNVVVGGTIVITPSADQVVSGVMISPKLIKVKTDANGYWSVGLVKNAEVTVTYKDKFSKVFVVSSEDQKDISQYE